MRTALIHRIPWACPRCRGLHPGRRPGALKIESVLHEVDGNLIEGFLACGDARCGARYPVIEGVPIVLKDPAGWWEHNSLDWGVGACVTRPMADFCNSLQNQSARTMARACLRSVYLDAHYPAAEPNGGGDCAQEPDNAAFWRTACVLADESGAHTGPALDVGCGVGRYTFELARHRSLVIGLDLNFDLLRCADAIQRQGYVDFERRIHGRRFQAARARFDGGGNAVFMVADAMDPPFEAEAFDLVAGLNVIDNVAHPLTLLGQMDALLSPGGRLVLVSPYEWHPENTAFAQWLERPDMGSDRMTIGILTGNLAPRSAMAYAILEEHRAVPWVLRQHDRLTSLYHVHMIAAQKSAAP